MTDEPMTDGPMTNGTMADTNVVGLEAGAVQVEADDARESEAVGIVCRWNDDQWPMTDGTMTD